MLCMRGVKKLVCVRACGGTVRQAFVNIYPHCSPHHYTLPHNTWLTSSIHVYTKQSGVWRCCEPARLPDYSHHCDCQVFCFFFQTMATDGLILRLAIHPTFPLNKSSPLSKSVRAGIPPGAAWQQQNHKTTRRHRLFSRNISLPSGSRVLLCFTGLMEKLRRKVISWDW